MKHKKMTIVLMAIMVMVAMTACSVAKPEVKPETETSVTVVSGVDTTTGTTTGTTTTNSTTTGTTAEGTTTVATTTEGTTKPAEATTTTTNGATAATTTTTTTTVAETIPAPVETTPALTEPEPTATTPAETTPAPAETEPATPNLHATADIRVWVNLGDGGEEFYLNDVTVSRISEEHPWGVVDYDTVVVGEVEARYPDCGSYSSRVTNLRDVRP